MDEFFLKDHNKNHGARVSKVSYIYCEKIDRTWLDAGMPNFYCVYLQILVAKRVVPNRLVC
jgi:hypothetical protein